MAETEHRQLTTRATNSDGNNVVRTKLNFYLEPSQGGHVSYSVGTAGYYRRKFDTRLVEIHDMRGNLADFNLCTHGFQYHKHVSAENDFTDDEQVKRVVYPEVEQLLKNLTGSTKVHVFSHITRRQSRDKTEADIRIRELGDNDEVSAVTPARFVHIDQSNLGAVQVLRDNICPTEVTRLRSTRWSIINVWRPIKGPITKDPLGVCDGRTVKDEDLVPIMNYLPPKGSMSYADISRGDGFEEFYARYQPEQKWYFVSGMTPEEVLLIKCFDSIEDGTTVRRVPHSAFVDPKTEAEDSIRESVEVRALVFYENQPNR